MILLKTVINTVKYLHHKNIVHRDLKPGQTRTITMMRTRLKLIDVGVAIEILNNKLNDDDGTLHFSPCMHLNR